MASLSKTHHLFAFTSPRTIEKIIPEILLLTQNYQNQKWTASVQSSFYEDLFSSDTFLGESKAKNTAFAARDRITRAPKALGFVDLNPTVQLTEAGKALVSGVRTSEVITRQLLKFQLPSHFHTDKNQRFFVKPYLEFLRLVKTVDSLSKTEIALFFLQLTKVDKFEEIVAKITEFRLDKTKWKGNRKTFVEKCFFKEIINLFENEITEDHIKTRESDDESLANFVKTKKQNMTDYADAFIRYIRATQLITFQAKTYRVIIAPSKVNEVDFILDNVERYPLKFSCVAKFKEHLFSATNIKLLSDDKALLTKKLQKLNIKCSSKLSLDALKNLLEISEKDRKNKILTEATLQLKNYSEFDDILNLFQRIQKIDVPDPPLYLEWNVWRAMTMVNCALSVQGNFTIDTDGVPLNTAAGNKADIEIEYDKFKMIVEVTLSNGHTQFNMEGESVARHFGLSQKDSSKPVFCFFIAPKISDGALAHFFNLNRLNTKLYGGKTRIVPMNIASFVQFVTTAKTSHFSKTVTLLNYLKKLIGLNQIADDELIWSGEINKSVESWTNY